MSDFCRAVSGKGGSQARSKLTLIVLHDIAEVIAAAVVGLADAYGVVREVDIAIVAWGSQQSMRDPFDRETYRRLGPG